MDGTTCVSASSSTARRVRGSRLRARALALLIGGVCAASVGPAYGQAPCATPAPGTPCPSALRFVLDRSAADFDLGWTGSCHDETFGGDLTLSVSGCGGSAHPGCGVCQLAGPLTNRAGTPVNNRRCTGDTSLQCTSDGECADNGTCAFFLGAPLPLSVGGLSYCTTQAVGPVTGTTNLSDGSSAFSLGVTMEWFRGRLAEMPCPRCVGDSTPNDGVKGGTCLEGAHNGEACDVHVMSPTFGASSFDCPPHPFSRWAGAAFLLNLSTGEQTRQVSAESPNCSAPGFTTLKCFSDTCNNAAATPCFSNADCVAVGASVCGGERCQGGTNNGAPCTNKSECPGGGCGIPGKATATNECADAVCTPNTPPDNDSINEGVCNGGPFEQYCSPWAVFTQCTADASCTPFNRCVGGTNNGFVGCTGSSECPRGTCEVQTCSIGKFRECFTDNGQIGAAVSVRGAPALPCADGSTQPSLGGLFSHGPTQSGWENAIIGLPGLGRLTVGTPLPPLPTPTPIDHFTCYNARATSGSVKFPGIAGLPLTDQFGPSTVEVRKPQVLCAPTDKNNESPGAELDPEHLKGYQIKAAAAPAFPTNIQVVDQFNPAGLFVDARKQSHLLVPTVKDLGTPPPMPGAFTVDHFECYKVTVTSGTAKFAPVLTLPIKDQFGVMTVDVKRPKYLCNPVDKRGEDPSAPTHPGHLMCYQVRQVDAVRFMKRVGVFVNNQFGPETLDVKKPSELCVPAFAYRR